MSVFHQAMARVRRVERQDDPVHGDRDPADPAVLARRDVLAAPERAADRRVPGELDDRQIGRDRQPDQVEDGEDEPRMDPEQPARRDALGQDAHERAAAAAASIIAPSSLAVCRPTIAWPLRYMVGVALTPLAGALLGLGTHGCLLRPGRRGRRPTRSRRDLRTSRWPAAVRRRTRPGSRRSGWRTASRGTASSGPGRRRSGRRRRPRPTRRRRIQRATPGTPRHGGRSGACRASRSRG